MFIRPKGFTLVELSIVVAIIGILASIAVPSYLRYINEAKATDVVVHIHRIALAYMEASYEENYGPQTDFDSLSWGKAPPAMQDVDDLYVTKDGLIMRSYVSNHSHNGQYQPVLFIKAPSSETRPLLYALDHILQQEHSFSAPNFMIIPLSSTDHAIAATSSPSTITTSAPVVATPPNTATQPSTVTPAQPTVTLQAATSTTISQTPSHNVISSSPTVSSPNTLPLECYRHPGWMKHHLHGC